MLPVLAVVFMVALLKFASRMRRRAAGKGCKRQAQNAHMVPGLFFG
jgi:hypothetical protein